MSNFWLDKKQEREEKTLNLMEDAMCCYTVGRTPPAPATKTIPLCFEEVIKAALDKCNLVYFASSDYVGNACIPDVITFGPSGPTIVEICQAEYKPELNSSIGTWELDL